ncbi:MAG: GAF domain-containing protein [Chloroflexi bacterium]|nr:GAF domain-containing protein [Chloroflexota bacterium]
MPSLRQENRTLREKIVEQENQIRVLNDLLGSEEKHSSQLQLLSEVEQILKSILDIPVSAQLVVNAIQHAFHPGIAVVMLYDAEQKEFSSLAVSGEKLAFPLPSYRQRAGEGLIGRAANEKKAVLSNDTGKDPDFIPVENRTFFSEIVVPFIQHGQVKGALIVGDEKIAAFSTTDVSTLEIVGEQLLNAWERYSYHERLTHFIQEGTKQSTLVETQAVIEHVAKTALEILEARFTFMTLLDQEGSFTRTAHSGNAPQLLRSLRKNPENDPLIQTVLNASQVLHLRDIRKEGITTHLRADRSALTNLLAFPVRLHNMSIGVLLVFGKRGQDVFSENDESLIELIATQAAAAIESAWLYQELRSTLQTATQLYQLSTRIMQAENLTQAAEAIAETAFRLGQASLTGIVLHTPDGQVQAEVEVDIDGTQAGTSHPTHLIEQAIQTGQTVIVADDRFASKICIPLQTPHRTYGALWLDIPEGRWYKARYSANLHTLTNQAIVALERSILLTQTRNQARQLEEALRELEQSYDKTLAALISALDARDRETEGHSNRVSTVACRLGEKVGLTAHQGKALERGSLLHDIGKIGIADAILLKPGPLTGEEWQAMRQHPEIGARIVEMVPFLADTIPIIRYHHERWDGSGYPIGLAGDEIPVLARIFAVADAFDALISDRPYRKGTTEKAAIEYLREQSGILFDPKIVAIFINMLEEGCFKDVLRKLKSPAKPQSETT